MENLWYITTSKAQAIFISPLKTAGFVRVSELHCNDLAGFIFLREILRDAYKIRSVNRI
jgi:hypothetical protein